MVRTVRVRLELDRNDYKQGLRDAAGDTRAFDAEVQSVGKSASRTGVELKDTDTAAKKLGDDVKQSSRDIRNLAGDLDTTRSSLRNLADEYKSTGSVELDRYRSLTSEMRKLERAKRDLDKLITPDVGDNGRSRSGGFLSSMENAVGSLMAKLPSISTEAGSVFGGGFLNGLKAVFSAAWPVLVPAIAVLVADLGAMASGALISAVGGVGLAAGIIAQASDPRVKAAFSELGAWAKSQLDQATSGFAPAMAAGFNALQREAQPFFNAIRQPLQDLAPVVANLLARLGEGLAKLGPGLAHALEAAGPILERIGADLPMLFGAIGGMLDQISSHAKGAGEAIDLLFHLAAMGAAMIGGSLSVLSDIFNAIIQGADAVTGFMAKIPGIGKEWAGVHSYVDGLAHSMDGMGMSAGAASGSANALSGSLGGVAGAATAAAGGLASARDAAIGWQNAQLASDQATLAANQSLLALDDSVKQHGRSLKDNTADGIANRQALDATIQSYEGQREAAIAAAGGQNASAAAVQAADDKFHQQIQTLMDHAGQLFNDKQHVHDLVSAIVGIPNEHMTNIEILGLAQAQGGLSSIASWLNSIPSTKRISIISTFYTVQGTTPGGLAGPKVAQRYGGVVAYAAGGEVDYKARSGILAPSSPGTILAGEPSTGGEVMTPRLGISNERGLALANIAARWHGGHVVAGTPRMGGGGATTNVYVTVNAGLVSSKEALARDLGNAIKPYVNDVGGGNVQAALGRRGA